MKKYIWISLLFFIGCGSRKSTVAISKETTEKIGKTDLSQKVEYTTKQESTFDLSTFLDNQNISIAGDGNPFTINYKGFTYSGTAPVEISNKKEQIKTKFVQNIKTIYKSEIQYQTRTIYKTQIIFKEKQSESKRPMFWTYILSGVLSIGLFLFLTNKFKI